MENDRYHPVSRPYASRHGRILTEHVFDKLRSIGMTLAEFKVLLENPEDPIEVIGEAVLTDAQTKELLLSLSGCDHCTCLSLWTTCTSRSVW